MAEQTEDIQLPTVEDPKITFRLISDRIVRQIVNEDIDEPLIEISGYDLQINFNMKYLKSVQDIDAACNGVAQLFRKIITEKLLEYKKQTKE